MAEALAANKIDAFPGDEPVIRMVTAEHPSLGMLDDRLESAEFGVVFPKTDEGRKLKEEFDGWLEQERGSGALESLTRKWVEGPEEEKTVPDYASLPAPNETLTMATEGAYPPMNYYREDEIVGMEVDLAARFCESQGYGLKIQAMNFDGILPTVQSGKADFSMAGISINEERAESVYFSEPYYVGGTVLAVRAANLEGATGEPEGAPTSFADGVAESFSKTFLRESRWKVFVQGVAATLTITLASILLGTALGFFVFLLCRNGGTVANAVSGFCMLLLQGVPTVVLLMILYYIVFGGMSSSTRSSVGECGQSGLCG